MDTLMTFTLNGKTLTFSDVAEGNLLLGDFSDFERQTLEIIKAWLNGQTEFTLHTSGSTGKPKPVTFNREQIAASARRTLKKFGLKKGDKMLCCLPPQFVAGFMMLIRGLEGNLEMIITEPTVNPFKNIHENGINFMAVTPMQAGAMLKESPEKFTEIDQILIGGAGLHRQLEEQLSDLKPIVFHSYGMTETLTHVALQRLNGMEKSPFFHALEGVHFETDDRNCLIIDDEILKINTLLTNDIVELIDKKTFRWIGRYDMVANSGGVKINLEETEAAIHDLLAQAGIDLPLCLIAAPDPIFTHKLVLMVERPEPLSGKDLLPGILGKLPKYHMPKEIVWAPALLMTSTGKIDRSKNLEMYLRIKNHEK